MKQIRPLPYYTKTDDDYHKQPANVLPAVHCPRRANGGKKTVSF